MKLFDQILKIVNRNSKQTKAADESLRYLLYSLRGIQRELDSAEKHLKEYLDSTLPKS